MFNGCVQLQFYSAQTFVTFLMEKNTSARLPLQNELPFGSLLASGTDSTTHPVCLPLRRREREKNPETASTSAGHGRASSQWVPSTKLSLCLTNFNIFCDTKASLCHCETSRAPDCDSPGVNLNEFRSKQRENGRNFAQIFLRVIASRLQMFSTCARQSTNRFFIESPLSSFYFTVFSTIVNAGSLFVFPVQSWRARVLFAVVWARAVLLCVTQIRDASTVHGNTPLVTGICAISTSFEKEHSTVETHTHTHTHTHMSCPTLSCHIASHGGHTKGAGGVPLWTSTSQLPCALLLL